MKENEKKTPDEIKEVVEEIAEVVVTTVEEKAAESAAASVEEKKAPVAEEKADEPEVPNVEEKAVAEEKAAEPAAPVVTEKPVELIIESTMGGQISADEIINRVKEKRSDAAKIYVKPEENKAYYTYGDSVGAIELW